MLSEDLFRKEAVDFATQRLYGHVVVLPKISHIVWVLFVVVCVVLATVSLSLGKYVERAVVRGELHYRAPAVEGASGPSGATAELFLPPELAYVVAVGDPLFLDVPDFDSATVGRIAARVARVSDTRTILAPTSHAPGTVYLPVILDIDTASLEGAGLPATSNSKLAVSATLITGERSWLRWLVDALRSGVAKA